MIHVHPRQMLLREDVPRRLKLGRAQNRRIEIILEGPGACRGSRPRRLSRDPMREDLHDKAPSVALIR